MRLSNTIILPFDYDYEAEEAAEILRIALRSYRATIVERFTSQTRMLTDDPCSNDLELRRVLCEEGLSDAEMRVRVHRLRTIQHLLYLLKIQGG